jgi:hypothetical protein
VAAPFYNAIKGTTSGTPGTGAFTPNAASTGYRAWSTVPQGWIGLVRYEDGSAWELSWSYWNGTTLSRGTNQLYDSSTGSVLSLASTATAAMVVDGREVQPLMGLSSHRYAVAIVGGTNSSTLGLGTVGTTGTGAASALATTNFLTEQPRVKATSATTANAQAAQICTTAVAVVSSTAGHGGWEFGAAFGASTLPTGPRLFVGMTGTTFNAQTVEPSAFTANYAVFAKDSTDTNIQLLVNSNVSGGTKIDTGILLVANGWYEAVIWQDSGSTTVKALLKRLDTGDIFYTTTSTDVPAAGALLFPQVIGGLNGTNTGTAFVLEFGQMYVRSGA